MEQSELVAYLVKTLERLAIPYQLTGSTATMLLGEPRLTVDIDVVVELQPSDIASFLDAFSGDEYYVSPDAVRDAVRHRHQFNILHPTTGLKIDVICLPDSDFAKSQWQRTVRLKIPDGIEANFISPEDVVLRKMEYYREGGSEKHLRDIAGVMKVQGERLDTAYIAEWSRRLGLDEVWKTISRLVRGT